MTRLSTSTTLMPILAGLAMLLLWGPVLSVDLPPLLDFPNHLARAVALAAAGTDMPAAKFYETRWGLIPNLGSDILLFLLLQFLPPLAAGRVFLLVVLTATVVGVAIYARVAFGRWTSWSLVSAVAAYNGLFLMGFVSFCLSCGLALGVAAWWSAKRHKHPCAAILGSAAGLAIVWFCHLGGVLLGALLITVRECERVIESRPMARTSMFDALYRFSVLIITFAPAGVLYLAAPISGEQMLTSASWHWEGKWVRLLMPIAAYFPNVDIAIAVGLIAVLVLSARVGKLELDWAGAITLVLCLLLFFVSPFGAMSGWWIDVRFATMVWLLFFACFNPRFEARMGQTITAVACIAAALKLGSIAVAWSRAGIDIAEIRKALTCVPPRSLVVVARADTSTPFSEMPRHRKLAIVNIPIYSHLGALALIDRGAFWPSMFANPSQQPISIRPPYDVIAQPTAIPPTLSSLMEQTSDNAKASQYAALFDFMLLLDAPSLSAQWLSAMQIEKDAGYAMLIKLRPRHIAGECPIEAKSGDDEDRP